MIAILFGLNHFIIISNIVIVLIYQIYEGCNDLTHDVLFSKTKLRSTKEKCQLVINNQLALSQISSFNLLTFYIRCESSCEERDHAHLVRMKQSE